MSQKPLLSICIPAYNRPQILEESLINCIHQIEKNNFQELVEIVVVDDSTHSPSNTMIAPYVQKHPYISYHKNEKNLGWINTVTHIKKSHWEYILLIADDDVLTAHALEYIVWKIRSNEFDFMLHQPVFSEHINIHITQQSDYYKVYQGFNELLSYIAHSWKTYQQLVSYFSFYSSVVVRASYLLDALENTNQDALRTNYFPHEFINYYNLQDKNILFTEHTLVIWRLLNESYPSSTILIKYLTDVFSFIEQQNNLSNNKDWLIIKQICLRWWKRTIYLGLFLKKLGIDYRNNTLLKKAYFFYKKYLQK